MAEGDSLEHRGSAGGHFSEETLESYSLGRLPPASQADLEEHLLICEECRNRVADSDDFVSVMRAAAMNLNSRGEERGRTRLFGWFAPLSWKPAAAVAMAVIAVLAVWRPWTDAPAGEEVEVHLHLQRGEAAELVSRVAAGSALSLLVDLSELPPQPVYRLEVVDAEGKRLWEGRVEPAGGIVVANTGVRVLRGNYWVRLFGGPDGAGLLREYGMKAE
jgi:hypothetical protein